MNTITAGDYTIELNISSNQWNYFLEDEFKNREEEYVNDSPGLYLKKVLKEQIEQIISSILQDEYDEKQKILNEGKDQLDEANTQFEREQIKQSLMRRAGTLRPNAVDVEPEEFIKKAAVANIAFAYKNHEVI